MARIVLIDDHPYSRLTAKDMLHLDHHGVIESDGSGDIVQLVAQAQPDLVLMDVYLGEKDGLEWCRLLKQTAATQAIPIILMTAMEDGNTRLRSRELGADAYLLKPLDRVDLLNRVDLLVQKKQLAESVAQIEQVLFRVAAGMEERFAVGPSRLSFGEWVTQFGEFLQLPPCDIQDLAFAARLHDLGMIQVPDAVMLKQSGLTPEELALVKAHVHVGATIFEPLTHRKAIAAIMRYHHEKWDGTGYPEGLKGAAIPYLAQVFQIIDIFYALTNQRRYKAAVSEAEALRILQDEAAMGWRNPVLVEQFTEFLTPFLTPV